MSEHDDDESVEPLHPPDLLRPAQAGPQPTPERLAAIERARSGRGASGSAWLAELVSWRGAWCTYFRASMSLAVRYVIASVRRDRRSFCVGLSTVALVVAFTSLVQSAVDNSPVVFLKLSEDTAGEGDLLLQPDFANAGSRPDSAAVSLGGFLLNLTDVAHRLEGNPAVAGTAARWTLLGRVYNSRARALNTSAIILIIDSERERQAALGRTWERRALGPAETYATVSVLDEIAVQGGAGERVDIEINPAAILSTFGISVPGLDAGGSATTTASSAAELLSLLAGLGVPIGVDDGRGGRAIDVDAQALLRALAQSPFLEGSGINPALIPPLGTVTVNATAVLQAFLNAAAAANGVAPDGTADAASGLLALRQTVTVVEGVDAPSGKWPAFLGNVVVLEAQFVAEWLRGSALQAIDQVLDALAPLESALVPTPDAGAGAGGASPLDGLRTLRAAVASFNYAMMQENAFQVYVTLKNRIDVYVTGANTIDQSVVEFSNSVIESLGHNYPVTVSAPLATALASTRFIKLFLDQVCLDSGGVIGRLSGCTSFVLVGRCLGQSCSFWGCSEPS